MDSRTIARKALEIGAIKLDTKSFFENIGVYKPIFNDVSLFLYDPKERNNIRDSFIELMDYNYDALTSISYFGASIATSIADYLGKPFLFLIDRDSHGHKRYHLNGLSDVRELNAKRVVIIDERLNRGSSVLRATCALRNLGILSDKLHPIFDYGYKNAKDLFSGKTPFNEFGTKLINPLEVKPLFDLDTLLEVAVEDNWLSCVEKADILLWRDDYHKWRSVHYLSISRY
ncbi:MAG: hypothetical protein AABW90_00585 [Nanoarchaeota archaeon]